MSISVGRSAKFISTSMDIAVSGVLSMGLCVFDSKQKNADSVSAADMQANGALRGMLARSLRIDHTANSPRLDPDL
ncbi:protein of unknown function (plasmid) [Pararobbsia alpina]